MKKKIINKMHIKDYHITKKSSLLERKNRQKLLELYFNSPCS